MVYRRPDLNRVVEWEQVDLWLRCVVSRFSRLANQRDLERVGKSFNMNR